MADWELVEVDGHVYAQRDDQWSHNMVWFRDGVVRWNFAGQPPVDAVRLLVMSEPECCIDREESTLDSAPSSWLWRRYFGETRSLAEVCEQDLHCVSVDEIDAEIRKYVEDHFSSGEDAMVPSAREWLAGALIAEVDAFLGGV